MILFRKGADMAQSKSKAVRKARIIQTSRRNFSVNFNQSRQNNAKITSQIVYQKPKLLGQPSLLMESGLQELLADAGMMMLEAGPY